MLQLLPNTSPDEVTGVSVSPKTNNLTGIGNTRQLSVIIEPEGIEVDLTFTSSDETVVTIDNNGLVTAVGEGTATITVEANGITDTATINVIDPED